MSNYYDERILAMEFDNAQFERGAKETLGTLASLDKALRLEGATSGLADIGKAASGVALDGLISGAQTATNKFSALEVIAITALANITKKAVDAGLNIAKSLTITPIASGFSQYEMKMNSVKTIMESTGESMGRVNDKMEELTEYANKTIYSLSDMTRNIGKFTNAGISLDDSVEAMKGISNWAAQSGANATEAGRAMYNLAQSMSMGYVQYIDWKSIENANMATKRFKENVLEIAKEMGTIDQATIDAAPSINALFKDSLKKKWFTSDVLLEVLKQYGDETSDIGKSAYEAASQLKTFSQMLDVLKQTEQANWSDTFELIFGDLEHASKLWTDVGEVISGWLNGASKARNDFIKALKDNGTFTSIFNGIYNIGQAIANVFGAAKESFEKIFPPATADQVLDFAKGFEELTKKLQPTFMQMTRLKRVMRGIFSVFAIARDAIVAFAKPITDYLGEHLGDVGNDVLKMAGDIGKTIDKFRKWEEETKYFETLASDFYDTAKTIFEAVAGVAGAIGAGFLEFINAFIDLGDVNLPVTEVKTFSDVITDMQAAFKPLADFINSAKDAFLGFINAALGHNEDAEGAVSVYTTLGNIFGSIWKKIKVVAEWIGKGLTAAWELFSGVVKNFDIADFFNTLLSTLRTTGLLSLITSIQTPFESLTKVLDSARSTFDGFFGKLKELAKDAGFGEIFKSLTGYLKSMQENLKANVLIKIAGAIIIMAIAAKILSTIPFPELSDSVAAIGVMMLEMFAALAIYKDALTPKGLKSANKLGSSIIKIAIGMVILAKAMQEIAEIPTGWDGVILALFSIGALLTMFGVYASLMKGSKTPAKGMISLAASMWIMAKAMQQMAAIPTDGMDQAISTFAEVLVAMGIFTKVASGAKNMISIGLGMVLLAAGMKIMAGAMADFGTMKEDEVTNGLNSIISLLAGFALFTKFVGGSKNLISIGLGIVLISASMRILVGVVEKFAAFSTEQITDGLVALGIALFEIWLAVKKMPKDTIFIGAGLLVVAAAINLIGIAMKLIATMTWDELAVGLTGIGAALLFLTIGLNAMKGAVLGAAALVIATVALAAFVPILYALSYLPVDKLLVGLGAIAGVMVVLGVAGLLLGASAGPLAAFAGSMILVGVAIAAVGAGLFVLSGGLLGIGSVFTGLFNVIGGGLDWLKGLLGGVVDVVLLIIQSIVDLIPVVGDDMANSIRGFRGELKEALGNTKDDAAGAVKDAAKGIQNATPELEKASDKAAEAAKIDVKSQADPSEIGVQDATSYFTGFEAVKSQYEGGGFSIDQLTGGTDAFATKGTEDFQSYISAFMPSGEEGESVASLDPNQILGSGELFNTKGSTDAGQYESGFTAALANFDFSADGTTVPDLTDLAGFTTQGESNVDAYNTGMTNKKGDVYSKGREIAGKGLDGEGSRNGESRGKGKFFAEGFANGISDKNSLAYSKAWSLAGNALQGMTDRLDEASPSKETYKIGAFAVDGFTNSFDDLAYKALYAGEYLARNALDGTTDGLSCLSDIVTADTAFDYRPVIKPVLDLSDVEAGLNTMNAMLTANRSLNMELDENRFSRMSSAIDRLETALGDHASLLSGIQNALENQGVYLDSGALVGRLAPKIDGALGRRQAIANRGV